MNIAIIGYGKMGKAIEQIALRRNHKISYKLEAEDMRKISSEELRQVDVAIEFTTPAAALSNYLKCFEAQIPVVSGTTGWLDKMKTVQNLCIRENQTFFYASNFSIGVNLFFQLNRYLAKIMSGYPNYTPSIEETHHIHKLDAPSGTAITLAEDILAEIPRIQSWTNTEADEANSLSVLSRRQGEVPGTHQITYSSEVDDLSITHTAHSREGFAMGAVIAAEFVQNKKGFLSMKDLLQI